MKKLVFGLLFGIMLMAPVTAVAYQSLDVSPRDKWANEIYRFDKGCTDNDSSTYGEACGHVAVFDDSGNKCYVAYGQKGTVAISCVKGPTNE